MSGHSVSSYGRLFFQNRASIGSFSELLCGRDNGIIAKMDAVIWLPVVTKREQFLQRFLVDHAAVIVRSDYEFLEAHSFRDSQAGWKISSTHRTIHS